MVYNKFHPAKRYKWITLPLGLFKEMIEGRRSTERDNVILVTGARGEGKSTFVGKVLFQFDDFDPYECIVYNKEDMFKLVKKKNGYIWADEAVVNAARGNVTTRANKMLHEMVTINRDNFNILFFCMPFVEDFDTKILQYVSMWVHIDSRGIGVVLLPSNKGIFGKRNWDVDAMKKIFDEFVRENKTSFHVPYWIFPNFRGYVKFGRLKKAQEKVVNEIKLLRKNENLEKQNQQEVVVEVKQFEDYVKHSAKKLVQMIAKGEIRTMKQLESSCTELKVGIEDILRKSDNILKRSGVGKTVRQFFKDYDKEDSLVAF